MTRISVDLTRCQGYGNCIIAAPAEFDLDDNSLVKLLNEHPGEAELGRVREAVSLCPVQAITLTDD
jgi:ferredoxin